jgi:hypothetical protein
MVFTSISHISYSRALLLPLPSGFGLCNRVFSVVRQREEKAQIHTFFCRARRFILFHLFFFVLSCSFLLHAHERESFKKRVGAQRPPLFDT